MKLFSASAVAIMLIAPSASVSAAGSLRPEKFEKLLACRSIAESSARLACYDREAAEVAAAADRRDLIVVDRAEVGRARRSLFGFSLPSLKIFGGGDEEVSAIESTIKSAHYGNARWHVTLEDGARWVQVDTRTPPRDPRPGHKIRIRRAALGSYLANIDGQTAIRMRREN